MLLVREVRALAGNLSDEAFQQQVGPFALVRRPDFLLQDGDMLCFGDAEYCFLETHTLLSMLRTAGNY